MTTEVLREEVPHCVACGAPERESFNPESHVVECSACGTLYVSPRPTSAAIERFYSTEGHYDHWDEEPGRNAMWRRRVNRVRALAPSGRLLDVGAGQGDFGARARDYFQFEGTEISREAVRLAKERHGLTLHQGDVIDLPLEPNRYDVITMWHVLEHVASPMDTIARCVDLLKPGGAFVVAVPNTDHKLRLSRASLRAKAQRLRGLTPNRSVEFPRLDLVRPEEEIHLTHFTARTLEGALRRAGLSEVSLALDDYSADDSPRERARYYRFHLLHRATGLFAGPALYASSRKRGG